MILTRQTCGQRSSMAAGSKHQALALASYVSERIWCMFPVPKCRREWNLGLCSFSILAKSLECSCAVKAHDKFGGWRNAFCNRKSPPSSRILFANLKVSHKPGDVTFLYILTLGTFTKIAWKNEKLAYVFASYSYARALAACLPSKDHVSQQTWFELGILYYVVAAFCKCWRCAQTYSWSFSTFWY